MRADVTAIVTTVGRDSLGAAVESVLDQTLVPAQVLVVVDGCPAAVDALRHEHPALTTPEVTLLATGGGRGGAYARQLGTDAATSRYVAYLDDDDVWLPAKTERQFEAVSGGGDTTTLVACRVRTFVENASRRLSPPIPRHTFNGPATDAPQYLFARRRLGVDRNWLPTSTWLLPTTIAAHVGWSSQVRRHHDWDFALRFSSLAGLRIEQLPEVLVHVKVSAMTGMSADPDWATSLDWLRCRRAALGEDLYAEMVVSQALRYALQAHDVNGMRRCLRELRIHNLPSLRAVALAGSGLVPRAAIQALSHL